MTGHYPTEGPMPHQMPQLTRPPAVDWIKIAPYVTVLLTIVSGILGVGMWRMIDQISDTAKLAATNAAAIERIDRDRASRIATTTSAIEQLERRTGPIDAMLKDIGRLESSRDQLDTRLTQGRDERLADTAKLVDAMAALRTEVALLRQEQSQLRQAVEAREREDRPMIPRRSDLVLPVWETPG
ncbi:hypothetical protein ACFQ4O_02155 [Methylopila musalis]|uniref:Chromosome partition protein Smc n=1 Tax=Methylopila musalis TaxID=1134781 RepID=A0ABW3Z3F2_9HYPH